MNVAYFNVPMPILIVCHVPPQSNSSYTSNLAEYYIAGSDAVAQWKM